MNQLQFFSLGMFVIAAAFFVRSPLEEIGRQLKRIADALEPAAIPIKEKSDGQLPTATDVQ